MPTQRASIQQRAVAAIALLSLVPGCAQIVSRSTVEVMPRHDAAALVVGPPGGEITSREVKAAWTQDGDRLAVRLEESRTCNTVRHVPVVRIERVDRRTARGAMWFEYGFGAAAMAGGLIGLIRPEWFSQASIVDAQGQVQEDTRTGYRIGGILTGIGALLLVAGVIDTFRTRDQVRYADAYRREEGGVVECMDPLAPMDGQTVELLVGKWSSVEGTDDGGGARFLLPTVEELPEDARKVIEATAAWEAARAEAEASATKTAEEAAAKAAAEAEAAAKKGRKGKGKGRAGKKDASAGASGTAAGAGAGASETTGGAEAAAGSGAAAPAVELGPRPEPVVVKGVLRLDNKRALAVSFLVPYDAEQAKGYASEGTVDPGPSAGPAPRKDAAPARGEGEGSEEGAEAAEPDASEGAKPPSEDAAGETSSGGGAKQPSEAAGTGKPGEPTLKLGGSGTKKPTTTKKGEASLTLGGSGSGKSGTNETGTSTSKPDEAQ